MVPHIPAGCVLRRHRFYRWPQLRLFFLAVNRLPSLVGSVRILRSNPYTPFMRNYCRSISNLYAFLVHIALASSYRAAILLVGVSPRHCLEAQQTKPVTDVNSHSFQTGNRIVEPMISLAHCSPLQRILVAGAKSLELAFELNRRGFAGVASTANCGCAKGQYDIALVDWRKRTFKALETTLDWLVDFLTPEGLLVIWIDPQKPSGRQDLCSKLERRGFRVEDVAVHDFGSAVSARRREVKPLPKAA
jgi:hypothetical protein